MRREQTEQFHAALEQLPPAQRSAVRPRIIEGFSLDAHFRHLPDRRRRFSLGDMRLEALRTFALALPHTTVSEQWGGQAFKVEGKVFLHLVLDAAMIDSVVFKCAPEEFDGLTDIDGIDQAPYFAKRHWVGMSDVLALPAPELERRIRRSYDLVVAGLPKKVQAMLSGPAVVTAGKATEKKQPKRKAPAAKPKRRRERK